MLQVRKQHEPSVYTRTHVQAEDKEISAHGYTLAPSSDPHRLILLGRAPKRHSTTWSSTQLAEKSSREAETKGVSRELTRIAGPVGR